MNMNRLSFIILVVLSILFASCSDNKFSGFKEGENHVLYKVHYKGNSEQIAHDSDWMKVHMDYRLEDTILFSSKKNMEEDFIFPMIEPMFKGDIYEGLKMMGEGDSMTFAIVADSFFLITANLKKLPDFVEPGEPMYFDVKLLERYTDEAYKAQQEKKNVQLRNNELFKLKSYLKENNITTEPLASGLVFIPLKEGYGKKPDTGEMCRLHLKVDILDGEHLYSNFGGDPIDVEYGKNFDTKGFMQGIGMLNLGGKARFIVPSSIGVGEIGKESVPGFTTIIYEVELLDIRSVEEVQKERAEKKKVREAETAHLKENEPERIQKYVVDNLITQKPTSSGLYIIPLYQGNGSIPKNGDVIKIQYAVFTLSGKKIASSYDKNEPLEATLGQGQILKCWEEGIMQTKEGGKVRLLAPSSLAYGSGSRGGMDPYSPIIFEIEVLEILNR